MRVIFLDVDGVLNYSSMESQSELIADDKLVVLRELVEKTNAELVLSSSWRSGWSASTIGRGGRDSVEQSKYYFMLCARIHDYGMSFLSEIPRLENHDREMAIKYWIAEWPGEKIENYIILDDNPAKFLSNNKHLVLVSSKKGLEKKHIELALQKFGISEGKTKILIVDDIEVSRAVIKEALGEDFCVLEAEDGIQAIDEIEKNSDIALVITDIQMPKMDGMELIQTIRSDKKYNNIAIIANTQYGEPEQEERMLEIGADDFVYKPSNPKIIRHRVRNILLSKARK